MSTGAAIAAATAAMRHLLAEVIAPEQELADTIFTTQPPDIARTEGGTANQINLFLFRTAVNPAWSNGPMPGRTLSGEDGPPPLALTLSYLLTVYGRDNDAQRPFSHWLLGRAMGILHDNPVLSPEALRAAMPEAGPMQQVERVRLSFSPLSIDDLSKLWSGFQTQFRLSAMVEASVVLIESRRPVRTPLPVLRRGPAGGGVISQPDMLPPLPLLTSAEPATATSGETVILRGTHLGGANRIARLVRNGRSHDLPVPPGGDDRQASIVIPADTTLGAGFFAVSLVAGTEERMVSSNAIALCIAPRITTPLPMTAALQNNRITVTLDVTPPILPGQRAALLLGARETPAPDIATARSQISFVVLAIPPGDYLLRLRVDGVDSQAIRAAAGEQPMFDPAARLTVTP